MAENQDGQERTEEPTGKRLEDARTKGQIPRSRELNTMAMTMVSGMMLLFYGKDIVMGLGEILTRNLVLDRRDIFETDSIISALVDRVLEGMLLIAPFLAVTVIVAIAASIALGGWAFSIESLKPKLEKLNVVKGIAKLFGVRGLMEMLKALAKFVLVSAVAITIFASVADDILALGFTHIEAALAGAGKILTWSFVFIASSLIVVAAIDVPFQLWDHKRNLKMTKQELKDEAKDTEGKPEIKRKIRETQMQMAMRRMMEAVPEADVVITNPTHFAVALKYDDDADRAPRVVAKGADNIAWQIRERAMASSVPIFQAPPLARAIYHSTDLDQEIPAGLYLGVAQVLAYVFQLRTTSRYGGEPPRQPKDIPIPDEYYYPPAN